jgi:hypothetical protein
MVSNNLEEKVLQTIKDTKSLCEIASESSNRIRDITEKIAKEVREISEKQDYLITNLREECYTSKHDYYEKDWDYSEKDK